MSEEKYGRRGLQANILMLLWEGSPFGRSVRRALFAWLESDRVEVRT